MAKLKINHYVVGPVQTNCYFAINDETKELIIIDPGYSPKQLAERVRQEGCTPVAILLTHDILIMQPEQQIWQKNFRFRSMPMRRKKKRWKMKR